MNIDLDLINANADIPLFTVSGKYIAKIVYCYDGDTIHVIFKYNGVLMKFRLRLLGYNAPELKPKKGSYFLEKMRCTLACPKLFDTRAAYRQRL